MSQQLDAADAKREFHPLKLAEVIRETADASSFVLEIPVALASTFAYRAGQFLTFRIPWDDFQVTRCYSLASSPDTGEAPKITVKRVDDGRVSHYFNDRLSEGDTLSVQAPAGRFVLRESDAPLSLFAGGSGITPVISILKTALATTSRPIQLVYANRDPGSIIFRRELDRLAAENAGRLTVVLHLDSERGFLDIDAVGAHLANVAHADHYICGPTPFMDTVEAALEAKGVAREHLHLERFVSAVDPDRVRETSPVPTGTDTPENVAVTLEGTRHEVPYAAGQTLLRAVQDAGLDPPFSCEEGYCGCCMAKLVSGEVHMASHDALTQHDVDTGWILCCQSRPTTREVEVDFDVEY